MLQYIRSNASFYNRIAEKYFNITGQAKTKEEYEKLLFSFCKIWQRELTDENVLTYFIESGEMELDTVDEFRQFYIDNAEPFQKAIILRLVCSIRVNRPNKSIILFKERMIYNVLCWISSKQENREDFT